MHAILAIIVVLIIVLVLIKKYSNTESSKIGSFRARRFLMSKSELAFYKAMCLYLPPDKTIMSKVGLKDIIETTSSDKRQRSSDWGRIKSKHVDFILLESSTSQILACIELDDSSHSSQTAQKRDNIKNDALSSASIPLKRVKASSSYSKEQIIEILK